MNEESRIDETELRTHRRPKYTMAELLAESDYLQTQPRDQREWVDAPATGGELL